MAYLVRDARSRSPYWYGVYLVVSRGVQRRWVRKSTKKRKRSEAKEILDAWQKTADRASFCYFLLTARNSHPTALAAVSVLAKLSA